MPSSCVVYIAMKRLVHLHNTNICNFWLPVLVNHDIPLWIMYISTPLPEKKAIKFRTARRSPWTTTGLKLCRYCKPRAMPNIYVLRSACHWRWLSVWHTYQRGSICWWAGLEIFWKTPTCHPGKDHRRRKTENFMFYLRWKAQEGQDIRMTELLPRMCSRWQCLCDNIYISGVNLILILICTYLDNLPANFPFWHTI